MVQTATVGALTRRRAIPLYTGAAAFALATTLGAVAIFGPQRQDDQVDAFPALVVWFGVLTALTFGLVVRPAATNGASSRRVVVLGALACLGNVVFWAGLPAVLGVATLALRPYVAASRGRAVASGLALAALAANLVAALVG
jgi:hypothetical protein